MKAEQIFELATHGGSTEFANVVALCERVARYCLVDGLAVNCYVEPVYTLDADFVLVASCVADLKRELIQSGFRVEEFAHSLNAQAPASELRIQFTSDPRYQTFPVRAEERDVLGVPVRVAALEDIVQGKLWAYLDPQRRMTKRKKDELDLLRLGEAFPQLRKLLPSELQRQFKDKA